MHFKSSFRRSLERLYHVLGDVLSRDNDNRAEYAHYMVPVLYHLLSSLWCRNFKDYLKK